MASPGHCQRSFTAPWRQSFGYLPTLVSMAVNLGVVYATFVAVPGLGRFMGPAVSRAIAKVASLFLAAISVAMIRAGIVAMVAAL